MSSAFMQIRLYRAWGKPTAAAQEHKMQQPQLLMKSSSSDVQLHIHLRITPSDFCNTSSISLIPTKSQFQGPWVSFYCSILNQNMPYFLVWFYIVSKDTTHVDHLLRRAASAPTVQ